MTSAFLDDAGSEFKKTADTAVEIGTEVAKDSVSSVNAVASAGKEIDKLPGSGAVKNAADTAKDIGTEVVEDSLSGISSIGKIFHIR